MKTKVTVNDKMQSGYTYILVEPVGRNFDPDFSPELTPQEMLTLGVFGGKYMTDCRDEFPRRWFVNAKLSSDKKDITLNYFGVDASQSLSVWRKKDGFVTLILEDGFSGTAGIIWDDAVLMMRVKSSGGRR